MVCLFGVRLLLCSPRLPLNSVSFFLSLLCSKSTGGHTTTPNLNISYNYKRVEISPLEPEKRQQRCCRCHCRKWTTQTLSKCVSWTIWQRTCLPTDLYVKLPLHPAWKTSSWKALCHTAHTFCALQHQSHHMSGVQKTCFVKEHQGWSLEVTLKTSFSFL